MAVKIFKDDAMQTLFDKQGFTVVPFLEDAEVRHLNDVFDSLHLQLPESGFVSGSFSSDFEYKKRASDEIVKVFGKHFERLFEDYKSIGAAFLFKMPSENSSVSIHQDWTIVDEEKYVALNCWVPLTDVNAENGALSVVPGTHYDHLKTLRAPSLPFFFSGNDDLMMEAAVAMNIKAGQAVILNQSVVHASSPNKSAFIRKAITAGVVSKDAPMIFHYKDKHSPADTVEVYDMPSDFLIRFENFSQDIFDRPKLGTSRGIKNYRMPSFSREALMGWVKDAKSRAGFYEVKTKPSANKSIFKRIAAVFQ